MEQLGLPIEIYPESMAETLAMTHWCEEIDANDVEFVLAPPRCESLSSSQLSSRVLGEHVLWLLDFDCCRSMSMDQNGIDQAVTAFLRNDPFYLRPGTHQRLWEMFRDRYLQHRIDSRYKRYSLKLKDSPGAKATPFDMHTTTTTTNTTTTAVNSIITAASSSAATATAIATGIWEQQISTFYTTR